jgi:hypothetical protein
MHQPDEIDAPNPPIRVVSFLLAASFPRRRGCPRPVPGTPGGRAGQFVSTCE